MAEREEEVVGSWMNFLLPVLGKEPFRLGLWSVSPASGNCKFLSGSSSTIYVGSL